MKKKALILLGLVFLLMMPSGAWLISSSLSGQPPGEIQSHISEERDGSRKENNPASMENKTSSAQEEAETSFDNDIQEAVASVINETRHILIESDMNIVAIGDSLTQGVGDSTKDGGYVGILEKSLKKSEPESSITIKNYGKRGNRSDQILRRLEKPNISSSVKDADMILLTVGANDIMKIVRANMTDLTYEAFADEKDNYEERLELIFDRIRAQNEEVPIYLVGIYNPFNMYFSNIPELNQIVGDWNTIGRDVTAEQDNAVFIPIQDIFQYAGTGYFSEDNFHPNQRGYASIADRVLDYIEPGIEQYQDNTESDEASQNE
ncbi:SGNH/GDSL hydrolase family protein [Salibacterium aidingense]|uniref:SGNH/GDSL hydrolase family protein n=1 Tax=Salibacterium aidingense TaxID=384933 RepID=UPI003BC946B2